MKKILILSIILVPISLLSQKDSLSVEQMKTLTELSEYAKIGKIVLIVWAVIGPILGAAFTYLGIKNKAEKWAEDEIVKKANEKFGVDWSIVKKLVDEKKGTLAKRSLCKIAAISTSNLRNGTLADVLVDAGFAEPIWYALSDFKTKFDTNKSNFILIDNSSGQLNEDEIKTIVDEYLNGYKFIWYTIKPSTHFNTFRTVSDKVSFVQKKVNLVDSIDDLRN